MCKYLNNYAKQIAVGELPCKKIMDVKFKRTQAPSWNFPISKEIVHTVENDGPIFEMKILNIIGL